SHGAVRLPVRFAEVPEIAHARTLGIDLRVGNGAVDVHDLERKAGGRSQWIGVHRYVSCLHGVPDGRLQVGPQTGFLTVGERGADLHAGRASGERVLHGVLPAVAASEP